MKNSPKEILPKNVLLFPYGSEISNEIVRALVANKHFRLMLATSDDALLREQSSGEVEYLPHVSDPDFEFAVAKFIDEKSISFVIPAHDDVALRFSEMDMPDECKVIGQDFETNRTVRHKKETYRALDGVVPVPRTFAGPEEVAYPVFVKPDCGQGSKNTSLVTDAASLKEFLKGHDANDFVFSEYLPGEEYTIDCFSDHGSLKFAGPRTRDRTINGISSLSRTVDSGSRRDELLAMAEKISVHFGMHGLWFFQAKENRTGELNLLEVATRVSGTMMVNRARGVNFVELALWQASGHAVEINPRSEPVVVRRTLEPHYDFDRSFQRLLVDFDDTLLLKDGLNVALMTLIFTAKNQRKPVILITKNQKRNLTATLHEFGISAVFDEILHLGSEEHKSGFLREGDLLVDDSYAERAQASKAGAKSISLDMIEMYIER